MQRTKPRRLSAISCCFSIIGCAFVTAKPVVAQAEPQYRVEFSAPKDLPNCNDPNGFRGLLELALSRDLLEPPASRVLDVRIQTPNSSDVVVDITLEELDGRVRNTHQQTYSRSMECYKILHLTAVAAAIDMDRDAPDEPPAPPKPPAPQPCPICEVSRAPAPKPLPPWFVGAGLRVDFGLAPDKLVGGHFIVGWRPSRSWSIEAHLRATFPEDTRPSGTTVVQVYSVASIGFVPCYRVKVFGLCGEFVAGNIWFQPIPLVKRQVDTALFLGIGARGFLEQRLSHRWSVRMDVDMFMPILPAQIGDDREQETRKTSVVAGSASASVLVSF